MSAEVKGHGIDDDRCPSCGDARADPGFKVPEPGFRVRRCRSCGAAFTSPAPADDEIGAYYPASYYGEKNTRFHPALEMLTRLFRRRRAEVFRKLVPRGPVLDVGCGRGLVLADLRELGYEAHGIELNEHAAWHARHQLGLDVWTGDLERSPHAPGSFHAVVFWHSLEHFRHPARAIERARTLLRPGGLIVVAVPNFDSLQARAFGGSWFHLDVPRHYVHFTRSSLEVLLARHGFRVKHVNHTSLEQNPYGWLQSAMNALGFEHNLLYSMLKSRSARAHDLKKHPLQVAAMLALLPAVLPLAGAGAAIEAALQRGGTIDVYAVRE